MRHCSWNHVSAQINRIRQSFAQAEGLPFANLLSPDSLERIGGRMVESSEPVYTPLVTLWMFLSQVFDHDHSCRQAVARLLASLASHGLPACSAATGGYCKARKRLSEEQLRSLVRETGEQLARRAESAWLWKGRSVKVADGTTVRTPDTPANQEAFTQPDGQRPGLGFPMARLVALFSLATGALLDLGIGAYRGKGTGELSLLRSIWRHLVSGDVLLGDRIYCSYCELAVLLSRGVDVVMHKHQSRKTDFRTGVRLGPQDHVIAWQKPRVRPDWMDERAWEALPGQLRLRELQITVRKRGYRPKKRIIVTTLIDVRQHRGEELAELYLQRWHAELDLRCLKQAMHMEELRSKTPAMVRKEIWVHLLAYNLIRGLIAEAARRCRRPPRTISFTGAVQTLNAFQFLLASCRHDRPHDIHGRLLEAMATHRVGDRPGRVEPRAKKRRKKNYPVLTQPRVVARKRLLRSNA
jgi:hypothetical protein